jgi:hypothetical protein
VAVLSMSKQEFSRLDVLLRVQSGRLRVSDACVLIGLQRRQVFRLLRGLKQDGATSLLSKRRGRPSNHRLPAEVRALALSIVRDRYADFGPTLAAEKLAEHHGCSVSHGHTTHPAVPGTERPQVTEIIRLGRRGTDGSANSSLKPNSLGYSGPLPGRLDFRQDARG